MKHLIAQHPDFALGDCSGTRQCLRLCVIDRLLNSTARLEQALEITLAPFRRNALRLHEDYEAVKAGVTLPWSNGQTEGQINRLKMLKRQMFGRAGIELLRRRFLNAV